MSHWIATWITPTALPLQIRFFDFEAVNHRLHCCTYSCITMWMIPTNYIARYTAGLNLITTICMQVMIHIVDDTTMYRFQTISIIWHNTISCYINSIEKHIDVMLIYDVYFMDLLQDYHSFFYTRTLIHMYSISFVARLKSPEANHLWEPSFDLLIGRANTALTNF